MRAWIALMRIDLKLALRNKSVLFFNYFFPLVFFFIFGQLAGSGQGSEILRIVAMVVALGLLGNGLFGAGMRAVQDREANVLRRYKVTPITPVPLLAASMITGVILYLPSAILTLILANRFYGMPVPPNLISLFLFIIVASIAFRSIGLIIASVVNSAQESILLIQPLYLAMLFLSGITIPITVFPGWLQIIAHFLPATYLMSGVEGILLNGESILHNGQSVLALLLTALVGIFISSKLFRWEKEEKLKPMAKLWVLIALLPFILLGSFQAWSQQEVRKTKILSRNLHRGRTYLIQNARILIGNGHVIESGAILIKAGKIENIFEGTSPDAKSLNAEAIDASGKTVLPGLIDAHIHLGASGGFYSDPAKVDYEKAEQRELENYLYSGVTAVRSAGDALEASLKLRDLFNSGEILGTEVFLCGPIFTVENGHGTEFAERLPAAIRASFNASFLRLPHSPEEARKMVDTLAVQKVDAIKGILDAGAPSRPFARMDINILRAVVDEAHHHNLPASIHTGSGQDVDDAVAMGADSIEHGSYTDLISDATFAQMKAKGIAFDPTLSVVEGFTALAHADPSLLKRSLVQQVTPKELMASTESAVTSSKYAALRDSIGRYPMSLDIGKQNLLRAWKSGVTLVTGTDAGNFLVLHGPTVQHEIELWISAGIPPEVAIEAATRTAANLLHVGARLGTLESGKDATLIIADGNPLQDIKALSSLSVILLKGERVDRGDLFDQK